ncbi:MAG: nucleoside-diphosphate kinase [Chloroflexi bacterium]|nr:nucleoside-diphosphate kinase [Chloroflexota bacterium]
MEQTFVLIKPDGVQRGLMGEIFSRLEKRGLKLVAAKFMQVSQELAETHYGAHKGKPFYNGLIKYITSAPVMAMIWEGPGAIALVRQTMGATNPAEADPGTIRHDLAIVTSRNLTHASDGPESAATEIALWFSNHEILTWDRSVEDWITGKN